MERMMNFHEIKAYLNVSRATLYKWVEDGKIPAIKMGGVWRFRKERIDKWLDSQENSEQK